MSPKYTLFDETSTSLDPPGNLKIDVAKVSDAEGMSEINCERWGFDFDDTLGKIRGVLQKDTRGTDFEVFIASVDAKVVGFARCQYSH